VQSKLSRSSVELAVSTKPGETRLEKQVVSADTPAEAPAVLRRENGSSRGFLVRMAKRLVTRLLPATLRKRLQRLEPKARPIYLRLMTVHRVRGGLTRRRAPAGARSFVAVCFGNIMRSPMVELMMKRAVSARGLRDLKICSAGLHATAGREAHPWALEVSRSLGLSLEKHRAQLLTDEMVERADAILAMDMENLAELLARYPAARDRIFMLSAYADGRQCGRAIPDPYFGDVEETRRCYLTLQACVGNLVSTLSADRQPEVPEHKGTFGR
jgi:protein-tyrosine-phosphatase